MNTVSAIFAGSSENLQKFPFGNLADPVPRVFRSSHLGTSRNQFPRQKFPFGNLADPVPRVFRSSHLGTQRVPRVFKSSHLGTQRTQFPGSSKVPIWEPSGPSSQGLQKFPFENLTLADPVHRIFKSSHLGTSKFPNENFWMNLSFCSILSYHQQYSFREVVRCIYSEKEPKQIRMCPW